MEVYILDDFFRRKNVVDKFESMIWTERFKRYGDFELKLHSTREHRNLFPNGTRIAINDSHRVMTVETIEDNTDSEGRAILTLKGRSLEAILTNRLARGTLGDLETTPKWNLTGLPAAILRQMFHDICVTGILDAGDVIPFVSETSIFPPDTIAEPTGSITYQVDPKDLYTAMYELADLYEMGFRLVRNPNSNTLQLYFDVYMGSDRTSKQTTLPAVVFSPDLENLHNTTQLDTIALYKNVAYVIGKTSHQVVYPLDVDPDIAGFQRNVLFVKADDIEETDPDILANRLIQRGKEELSKNRRFSAFDGELKPNSQYKYEQHYYLGDLVEVRNQSGATSDMQVTEQIFVSDKEGDRTFPTLSINTYITPGSWIAWDYGQVWEDVDLDEYWDTQP